MRWRPTSERSTTPRPRSLSSRRCATFISGNGAALTGSYIAPQNGACVVFLHGSDSDRRQLLPEATILERAGYGALLYDSPGRGESNGYVHWDDGEREALQQAIAFMLEGDAPRCRHLGLAGFSLGAMIALQVAVEDRRVEALMLSGAFGDSEAMLKHQFRRWGWFSEYPAIWAAKLSGLRPSYKRPSDVVASFRRPLWIVAGGADTAVPPALGKTLFDAAQQPKAFWVVPGAHHGDSANAGGEEYARRLTAFFVAALPKS
ncbi:MAG: alpha/beta hydrolase [Polyangiaceae bacterium]